MLSQFMELRDIPKAYGGELAWEFLDEPAWDEGILKICQWENGHTVFPPGPKRWESIEDGKYLQCVAVGYQDGKPRHDIVCKIAVLNNAVEKTVETAEPASTPATTTTTTTTTAEKTAVTAEDAPVAATPVVATNGNATIPAGLQTSEPATAPAPADGGKLPGALGVAGMAITMKGEEVYKGDHISTAPVAEVEALKLTDDEVKALREKKEDTAVPAVA